MNPLIAHIYGTHGGLDLEKTAGVNVDELPSNLPELAEMIVLAGAEEGDDFEKTAAAHQSVLQDLIEIDKAGRYMAHAEFSEMEKMAAEGDTSALEAFFADVTPQGDERAQLREAVKAELQRRGL
jgi:hypothetical protein